MAGSLQQAAMIALMRANSRIRRQYGEVFCDEGLGAAQYNILRILRGAGGSLPIMTIRERMIEPEPSITRLVDRLEERGWVCRVRSSEDRRSVECRITAAGKKLLARLDQPVEELEYEQLARLNERELKQLARLLAKVGLAE